MSKTEFGWKTKDGLKIYAYRHEPTQKSRGTVCLVHGLGEHSKRYEHVARLLGEAGYSFAGFDQRGHGRSQGRRGHTPNLETTRDDIAQFIDEVIGISNGAPVYLYGHSLGGMLVLSFLTRRSPELTGVISSAPILRPGFKPPAIQVMLGKVMRTLLPRFSMANGLDRDGLSRDAKVVEAYHSDPLVHDRISAQLGMDMLEEGLWLLENLPDELTPILLLHGSQDRICDPDASREYARAAGSSCTLKIWDGLFHEIHNEPEKEQVMESMVQWLDEVSPN